MGNLLFKVDVLGNLLITFPPLTDIAKRQRAITFVLTCLKRP